MCWLKALNRISTYTVEFDLFSEKKGKDKSQAKAVEEKKGQSKDGQTEKKKNPRNKYKSVQHNEVSSTTPAVSWNIKDHVQQYKARDYMLVKPGQSWLAELVWFVYTSVRVLCLAIKYSRIDSYGFCISLLLTSIVTLTCLKKHVVPARAKRDRQTDNRQTKVIPM